MPVDLISLKTLGKHWALGPVVAICGGGCVMCAGYIAYMCACKSDLSFRPNSWAKEAPYQSVKPDQVIGKWFARKKEHVFDPEIEALKRELGSYKSS